MKTLLLDKQYKPIAFIGFKKMIRLIMTEKADIISQWVNVFAYKDVYYPSIIILKSYIRKKPLKPKFTFKGIFRRDFYTCCYTGQALIPSQLTIDHILPKSRGGKSTWENCVTASREINFFKGNRTPEEAGLKLLTTPLAPSNILNDEYFSLQERHPDWEMYFNLGNKII